MKGDLIQLPTERRCTKCGTVKPLDAFSQRGDSDRRRSHCRECVRASNLERYHTRTSTKEAHRRAAYKHSLKKRYGLSIEEFEAEVQKRSGRCDICGDQVLNRLVVEHCHTTGRVRGFTCHPCNLAIGNLKDSPDIARRLADYLEA